ncbi:hypothetical protein N8I84_03260 [Streptomyces cynarae]|uniref:Uncharacterized protein n=1 Tax=Streptomyces cynarae TaxID=2981134 RepID=A0ABY6DWG6_9ACTN|nr:hypothetical protein [Streptomyces cynarae]UXY17861.1 hypothetical protein N8I84_03260 [Streptomyces cynarae]
MQRGIIIDTAGYVRMLQDLLGHRLPRFTRPHTTVTAPGLEGLGYRDAARAAVVLRPHGAEHPHRQAITRAAGADLSRPPICLVRGSPVGERWLRPFRPMQRGPSAYAGASS